MIVAGTPTAMEFAGTSHRTTALAPMITLSPMLIGSKKFCAGSNINVISDDWGVFLFDPAQADRDAISNPAIVAELCISTDDDTAKMIDHKIASDLGFAWKFNPGDDLNKLEEKLVNEREKFPNDCRPHTISPSAEPIDQHHPKSLGAPIAVVCAKVASDILEHATTGPHWKLSVIW